MIRRHLGTGAATLLLGIGLAMSASPAAADTKLPDTAAGHLAGDLVQGINAGSTARIEQWTGKVLSTAMPQEDRKAFIDALSASIRDSGGVDIVDVQASPKQPDMLQLVVKARRNGHMGLFTLATDPKQSGLLAQALVMPMEDPALYAGWRGQATTPASMGNLIHATLDKLAKSSDFSGCVTVADGDTTMFQECRGLADRTFGVPVDAQTKFHIGSIGKMFTAVAIAQLVEDGKLSWNDTLASRVPEYPDHDAASKITVWQLLHHTAGLGDFMVPEYFAHRESFIDPADYLQLIARQPRPGEPGKQWIYSNAGYVLLGRIIENVSHERYVDYIRQHIFTRAGMTASGFDRLDDVTPHLATGYYRPGIFSSTWKADWVVLGIQGGPAGGGYSNNTDLLRFAAALRGGKLVKSKTLNRMFEDQTPAGPGGYAAGFGDRLSQGKHIRGHAGGIEGTDANLQMIWGTGYAVALTSNQGPGEKWMLAEHIADLLAGRASP